MALRPIPFPVLSLGIDAGATSGAGLTAPTPGGRTVRLVASWTCKTAADRWSVVLEARAVAIELGLPLVAVAEDWKHHGMTPATFGGLQRAWGGWADSLELARIPVERVYAQTWRAGLGLKASGSDDWKRAARLAVRARFGIDVEADEAEGIAVSVWGAHDDSAAKAARRMDPSHGRLPGLRRAATEKQR